jgi:hypothetical protein
MRWPHLTVVLTSGNPGARLVHRPPGVEFLPKPWEPLNLLSVAGRARSAASPSVRPGGDLRRAAS